MNVFRTQHEADAYTLLHEQGIEGYDARWGMSGNSLLNEWAEAKLVRVTYPDGGLVVTTFKKYANQQVVL